MKINEFKHRQNGPTLFDFTCNELDEISQEDLDAAADKLDDIVKKWKPNQSSVALKKPTDNSKIVNRLRK